MKNLEKSNLGNLYKEVLTANEASELLGIAKSYLYKLTYRHEIPFYRPNGKLIYFERTDLMAWMRRNKVNTDEQMRRDAIQYSIVRTASPQIRNNQ